MKRISHFIAGHKMVLLPEGAIFWPENRTLLIADVHLGKAETFRKNGVSMPDGSLIDDLRRLSHLLLLTSANRIIVLGDLFHAKQGITPKLVDRLTAWREDFNAVNLTIINGNHDRGIKGLPSPLKITHGGDYIEESGILLSHTLHTETDKYTLTGHLHPAIRLFDVGMQKVTLPCFYFTRTYGVLPSFGSLTGKYVIRPKRGDQVFAIADDAIYEVSV